MNMRYMLTLMAVCVVGCGSLGAMQDLQKAKALIVLMKNSHISGQTDDELMHTLNCNKNDVDECRDILHLQNELIKKDIIENEQEKVCLIKCYLKNTQQDERSAVCELMKTIALGKDLVDQARKQLDQEEQLIFFIDNQEKIENSKVEEKTIDLNDITIQASFVSSKNQGTINDVLRRVKDQEVLKQEDNETLAEIALEELNERNLQQAILESNFEKK